MPKDEKKFLDNVAKQIAKVRKHKGITQEQLAENTGLDAVSIGYIEQGKRRPTLTTLYRIAKALKVKVADFL